MLRIDTAPASEPVTLAEAKAHLRVDSSDEDALIGNLVKAAREYCELFTRRSFITTTWKLTLDKFPDTVELARSPAQSVTSIKYIDDDGVQQTFASASYLVDAESEPGRVTPVYGGSWPSARSQMNAVEVTFKAGYGDAAASVPQSAKQAILMLVGHWFENRETTITGTIIAQVPMAVKALLWSLIVPEA